MRNYLSSISDYFNSISPHIYFYVGILKIIFIIVSLALFIGTIILLFKASWIKRRYLDNAEELASYKSSGAKKTLKEWKKITKRMELDIESEHKLAVLEADEMLDRILAKIGYSGETMGEKLKKIDASVLPNISSISEAHRIRNNIVHDPDYKLDSEKAKEIIGAYEQALIDLEIF